MAGVMKNEKKRSAHQLLQALPCAAVIVTRDMIFEDANDLFLEMLGKHRTEVVGRGVFETFPSHHGQPSQHELSARASVRRVFDTGETEETPIEQHDILGRSGRIEPHFWQVTNSRLTNEDGSFSVLQIVYNKTEQVMAERRACARERIAGDVAGVAFWDLNLESQELIRCPVLDRLHGVEMDEEAQGTQWLFASMHPEDRDAVRAEVERVKAAGEGVCRVAYRAIMPDGSVRRLVAQGEIVRRTALEPARLVGMTVDMTDFLQRGEDLEAALEAKDLLIDEVNHRVKNSLQMVSSILNLEAQKAGPEAREKLCSAAIRVNSIAMIHASLYQDDVHSVCMKKHLTTLCEELAASSGADMHGIEMRTHVADVRVSSEQAITLSLVVNELVTNSLKHGFPDGMAGSIELSLGPAPGKDSHLQLSARDVRTPGTEGGRSKFSQAATSTGLGSRLIRASVAQLGGTIEQVEDDAGWHTTITFRRDDACAS